MAGDREQLEKEESLAELREAAARAVRRHGTQPQPGLDVDADLSPKEELRPNEELDRPGQRSG